MSRKIWFPVFAALLLALVAGVWVDADAAAQGRTPPGRPRVLPGAIGQVIAVDGDQFTIQTRAGQERTFRIDVTTRFVDPEKQELSQEDLRTGGWVAVVVARRSVEPLLARLVVILPPGFDPANWAGLRGRVTAVDVAGSAFALENKNGQVTTVKVDANTKYHGQVTALADMEVGVLAQAVAEKQPNGDLLAKTVRAGYPSDQRFLGKVTTVEAQSFTIQTRRGQSLIFQVTEETRFRSRKGAVDSLDDLKEGMPVAVGAKDLGGGQYQALVVLAAPRISQ